MFFKNNRVSIRIVRRLELKRIYLGNSASWHWKKPLFKKAFSIGKRMNPHISIVGESGGGKSNACRQLLKELCKNGANVTVLDPNSDYPGIADEIGAEIYDASKDVINIFDLEKMSEAERISELMQIFRKRLKLGYVQSSLLRRCISYTYWVMKPQARVPTLKDLLYTIKVFEKKSSGSELRMLGTLRERLSLLNTARFTRNLNLSEVMEGNSVFLLSSLHTDEAQSVYMEGLLRKIYSNMLSKGHSATQRYIVIDEAKKLAESRILGRLCSEGRKYGIGIIAISQHAKEIDKEILGNSAIVLSFYQREPSELNYVANLISGGNELNRYIEVKKAIRYLRIGEAIVLDSKEKDPIIVSFEKSAGRPTSLNYHIISSSENGIRMEDLRESCYQMGFSEEETSAAMLRLKDNGLCDYEIESGRMKGRWYISNPFNSPEHDLHVNLISKILSEQGIANEIYNSSYGPDIIAFSKGERIAFEYETGSKAREQMESMLESRRRKYNKIVVAVNDSNYGKYEGLEGIVLVRASGLFESDLRKFL